MRFKTLLVLFAVAKVIIMLPNEGRAQSFSFDIQPIQQSINAGDTASFDILVTPIGGFSSSISFTVELPNCISPNISITPSISNPPYTNVRVRILNTTNVFPSIYPIVVKGSNGLVNRYDSCIVEILPDTSQFNWIVYQPSNSGIQSTAVVATAVDKSGKVWSAAHDTYGTPIAGNLNIFDGTLWDVYYQSQHKVFDNCGSLISSVNGSFLPATHLRALAIDSLDNKWVGTGSGLLKFDSLGNRTVYTTSNSPLPHNGILSIEVDALNRVWIGTDGGLAILNNNSWTVYTTSNSILPSDFIHEIAFDHSGNTWFGSHWYNLVKFDGTFFTIYNSTNSSIPSTLHIQAIVVDHSNNIWVGCGGEGVFKFDGINTVRYTTSNSNLNSNVITGAAFWKNAIWVLTSNNSRHASLSVFDGISWSNFDTTNSPFPVWGTAPGLDGDLYVNKADNSLWASAESAGLVHIVDTTHMGILITSVKDHFVDHESDILVYPNPSQGKLFVRFPNKKGTDELLFTLLDSYGRVVLSSTSYLTEMIINTEVLPSGIYFYRVSDSRHQKLKSGKLIVGLN